MAVAGEFERDHSLRSFPCRMIVQMTDEYRDAPIVGNRLVEVIVPHSLIVRRVPVQGGELFLQSPIVTDKFIQSIERPLKQDVLAPDQ